MTGKLKVLVFGFSVSEQKDGYVPELSSMLAERYPDVEVVSRALGGMHPPEAVHIFDEVVPRGSFDLVVLELMTTSYRFSSPTDDDYGIVLFQFIAKSLRRSTRVVVVNLPRVEVDYESDKFTEIAQRLCYSLNVPFANIAVETAREGRLAELIPDGVHTTPSSGKLFAEMLFPVVDSALGTNSGVRWPFSDYDAADHARCVSIAGLLPQHEGIELKRSFNPLGIAIQGGKSLEIHLLGPTNVVGLTYFMGPRTGRMVIRGSSVECELGAFDIFCYYERLNGDLFSNPISSTRISIYQDNRVPDLVPVKGEKDYGDRLGVVVHLLVRSGCRASLLEGSKALWH